MGNAPISFECAARRRERWRYVNLRTFEPLSGALREPTHDVVRTGRTKPRPVTGRRSTRTLDTMHEYRCSCSHVGWSGHRGVLGYPLEGETS
jgi:hypothetical protein